MDWLDDFITGFDKYYEIKSLKADKFHGNLCINFSDGVAHNYNLTINRRRKPTQTKAKE